MANIKLGIAPIAWTNDDMPDLGGENTFEQCVSEMALAGFTGCEVGNKYPKDTAVLKKALDLRGIQIASAWFSSFLLTQPYEQVEKDFIAHCEFLKAMGARFCNVAEQGNSVQGQLNTPVFAGKPVNTEEQWKLLTDGLNRLGAVAKKIGLTMTYHHHMGTGVQTEPVPGGSAPADSDLQARLKERETEIESLKKTLGEKDAEAEQMQKSLTGLNEQIRELTASLENQKNELQAFLAEKSKSDEDTRKLSRDLLNTQALLEKAKLEAQDTSKIRAAERERDEWKLKSETASKQTEELRVVLTDREKAAEIAGKKIAELETKCDTLEKRAARAETKLAGWESGANTVSREEFEKKNAAIEALLKEHKRLLEEQTADRKTISEINAQLVRYRKTLQLARDVTEKSMEESRKLRAELVMYRRRDPNPRPEVPKTVTDVPEEIKLLTPSENDSRAQAQKADPDKYETCMAAARKAMEQGKHEDALWQLWAAADAAVNRPEPYMEITRIHIARNNPEQGIKTYEKALRLGAKRVPEYENQLKQQLLAKKKAGGK